MVRIHTDSLTRAELHAAARTAGVSIIKLEERGSRKRDHAFEVALSGTSSHRTQSDRDAYAATWDEWGMFMQALYVADDTALIGDYEEWEMFGQVTGGRFIDLTPLLQHKRHVWEFDGTTHACACGAVNHLSPLWDRRKERRAAKLAA